MPAPSQPPTIPAVLDQADLETIVGVARLPQLLLRSPSESGAVLAVRIVEICQRATDHAAGILFQAWGVGEIKLIFDTDTSVWCSVRDLGAGFCGLYNTELVDPQTGTYPFSMQWQAADKALKDRVKGAPRIISEDAVGHNHTLRVRTTRRPARTIFGDGHGGF